MEARAPFVTTAARREPGLKLNARDHSSARQILACRFRHGRTVGAESPSFITTLGTGLPDEPAQADDETGDHEAPEAQHPQPPQLELVPQKPNDNPVVAKNAERLAGPANSVPRPTSQTIEGVSW